MIKKETNRQNKIIFHSGKWNKGDLIDSYCSRKVFPVAQTVENLPAMQETQI